MREYNPYILYPLVPEKPGSILQEKLAGYEAPDERPLSRCAAQLQPFSRKKSRPSTGHVLNDSKLPSSHGSHTPERGSAISQHLNASLQS